MIKRTIKNHGATLKSEKLFSVDYILIMFTAMCHAMMNQFFNTTTSLFVYKLGGTTLQAGLFATFFAFAALVSRPFSGVISDKFGRVTQLIIGAAICTASSLFFGIFSVIPILLVIRAFQGIGFGMHSTCAGAAAADVLPKSRMAEGIGYFFMYATIAQALGPGIALAIVDGDEISDYKTLFFMTAGVCLVCVISNFFISYERKRKHAAKTVDMGTHAIEEVKTDAHKASPSDEKPSPKTLLGFEYAVFPIIIVMITEQIGLSSLMVYIAPYAQWAGFSNPSLYFIISATGTFISRMFFGRVADKRGSDIIIIPGLIIVTAFLALIPFAGSLPVLVSFAFPLGLANGAVLPTFNATLFKRCSPARRGTASGAGYSSMDIGFALGAPFLGALVDVFDFRVAFWVGAVFTAASLVLYLFIASDRRHRRRHPAY